MSRYRGRINDYSFITVVNGCKSYVFLERFTIYVIIFFDVLKTLLLAHRDDRWCFLSMFKL